MLMTAPLDPQQHAWIERAVVALGQRNDTSLALWRAMATALGKIIGEAGFESLFFRTLYQFEARYPWMAACSRNVRSIDHLVACLATQPLAQAEEASTALLIDFTATLNVLIGELVTSRILLAAWGSLAVDDVPEQSK
jgi:hypothetical protein